MAHVIEPALSGRAKCRGCGRPIPKGELRLGERLPNPFADEGDMTHWFHLDCAAYKRPEVLLETLPATDAAVEDRERLEEEARLGVEHRRLPRVDGAQRAPTGRATCRHCREKIPKGAWRVRLVYYEDGRFEPSGFVHLSCAREYLGTDAVLERLRHFSPDLEGTEVAELEEAVRGAAGGGSPPTPESPPS